VDPIEGAPSEQQTSALYAALGEFAVEFEHVCFAMRCIIMSILHEQGLRNEKVLNILLAEQTAEPLRSLTASLFAETQQFSENDEKIIGSVLSKVQVLTQERNDVLHSTWFIGWYGTANGDFGNAPSIKPKRSKKGDISLDRTWRIEQFDILTARAKALSDNLRSINTCLSGGYKLHDNFRLGRDGSVVSLGYPYK
jgi:hypothetical protein